MRHEETRDNTTAIEALMMAGDAEEILVGLGHSPDKADRMVNGSVAEVRHEERNDGANGYDDEPEDDEEEAESDMPLWIADAQPMEAGWFQSQWFGSFHRVRDRWMYHAVLK